MNGSNSASEDRKARACADDLHETRTKNLKQRANLPTTIRAGPIAVLHAIPTEVETSNYSELQSTLPDPPIFGQSDADPETSTTTADGKIEAGQFAGMGEESTSYTYISDEGWFEAATTDPFVPGLVLEGLAEEFVLTLKGGLDCLLQLGAELPVYIYLSLIGVENRRMQAGHYQYAIDRLPVECTAGPAKISQFDGDVGEVIQVLMAEIREQSTVSSH